ncbi:aldo/keto reductase [Qiania dongpingensis]|uniref:Aldo/keto reductase n=1 Tax=Qiania dongpingensis TaxID=2763669 RepID=A0A7G9G3Y9_9FIRM|nr:aldo/keto reductase [Qiania dongpingensis]QNM05521.1 aldo/keto reductase [Qiania dongpingensis]
MEYRVLGRTGIKVSAVGLGGEGFEGKSYDECQEIVDCAMERGINFIDIYNSNPDVRSNVGKALSRYKRESFVVEGHLCSMWENGQYRRTRKLEEVVSAYEDFLERMRLDYVDIGMLHYIDDDRDFDRVFGGEVLEYVKELKKKGIIRVLGMSTHNPDMALRAVKSGIIDVILFSVNAAYDMLPASEEIDFLFEESTYKDRVYQGIDPKRAKLYQTCQNEGVALTVMKGYAAGVLLSGEECPFGKALTPVQCLHYCLTRPAVASVMVGAFDREQVLAAAAYGEASQEEKDYSEILSGAPRSSFHGHCMYCGHCAPCTVKIDIASVNKYLDLSLIQEKVPDTLMDHYGLLEHHAGECVECGKCMKNCPFGVDIIGKMRQAAGLFGK